MVTTKADIKRWFKHGMANNQKWMLIVCDTFNYEDYPAYAKDDSEFWDKYDHYDDNNMQKIMETYNLEKDMNEQLGYNRCYETPKRP